MTTALSVSTINAGLRDAIQARVAKSSQAFKEFEAVLLQGFVEAMLPAKAESVFGKGVAADTWKSFFAESIARELANSQQFGLASQLEGKQQDTAPIQEEHRDAG